MFRAIGECGMKEGEPGWRCAHRDMSPARVSIFCLHASNYALSSNGSGSGAPRLLAAQRGCSKSGWIVAATPFRDNGAICSTNIVLAQRIVADDIIGQPQAFSSAFCRWRYQRFNGSFSGVAIRCCSFCGKRCTPLLSVDACGGGGTRIISGVTAFNHSGAAGDSKNCALQRRGREHAHASIQKRSSSNKQARLSDALIWRRKACIAMRKNSAHRRIARKTLAGGIIAVDQRWAGNMARRGRKNKLARHSSSLAAAMAWRGRCASGHRQRAKNVLQRLTGDAP